MSDLAAALQIAIRVHAGQTDKQGDPYLLHVLRVVEAVSAEAKVVAALHDAFEDGDWGDDDASEVCEALDRDEVAALDLLTHVPDDTYAEYVDRIALDAGEDERKRARRREKGVIDRVPSAAMLAREVKLADLRDNLGRIPPGPYDEKGKLKHDGDPETYMGAWEPNWASLKARYEKAISTLSGASGER